jgi:hypothetical protein
MIAPDRVPVDQIHHRHPCNPRQQRRRMPTYLDLGPAFTKDYPLTSAHQVDQKI